MKSVIWLHKESYYLFVEEGVFLLAGPVNQNCFKGVVWTLVDSDESPAGVPPHLLPQNTRLFVVFTTAPAKQRWSRMHKTVEIAVFLMNPWTKAEIYQAALLLLPHGIIDHTRLNESYDRLGPTPRLCINYQTYPLGILHHERQVREAIRNAGAEQLEKLFGEAQYLKMDELSHNICLLSRMDRDDVSSAPVVAPISHHIQSRLANHLRSLRADEQVRLYQLFARVPESRRVAGLFYEPRGQACLSDGMILELVPMVTRATGQKRERLESGRLKPQPRWYSSHEPLSEALEVSRQKALQLKFSVNIKPSRTHEYTDVSLGTVVPNVFYVPEKGNEKALDSFILLDGILYILQFTIASKHDINAGLVKLGQVPGIPAMPYWRFVFIIPPNQTLTTPQQHEALQKLCLYSALFDVDTSAPPEGNASGV